MKLRILLASAVAGSTLFLGGGANAAEVPTTQALAAVANITPVANPIIESPEGSGKTLEATSNGWHLTMKALNKPKAGQPTNFMVEFVRDGAGPTGTIYLEQGWYWFTNYQLTSCAAKGATCLNFTTARDKTADGVDHGVIIQAINVPDAAKETKVQLTFTVTSGADPRCTFYTAAYREVAVNPILVAPPAVRDFGCKA